MLIVTDWILSHQFLSRLCYDFYSNFYSICWQVNEFKSNVGKTCTNTSYVGFYVKSWAHIECRMVLLNKNRENRFHSSFKYISSINRNSWKYLISYCIPWLRKWKSMFACIKFLCHTFHSQKAFPQKRPRHISSMSSDHFFSDIVSIECALLISLHNRNALKWAHDKCKTVYKFISFHLSIVPIKTANNLNLTRKMHLFLYSSLSTFILFCAARVLQKAGI